MAIVCLFAKRMFSTPQLEDVQGAVFIVCLFVCFLRVDEYCKNLTSLFPEQDVVGPRGSFVIGTGGVGVTNIQE